MKKLVLLICLLFPLTVFGATYNSAAECFRDFGSTNITANGTGTYNYCIQASCTNGKWQQSFAQNKNTLVCANGNTDFWYNTIADGCSDFKAGSTCPSNNEKKYCGIKVEYDCNKINNGSIYVSRKTTRPSISKTTTTTRRRTTKPSITKTTTTTTTTTVPIKDNNSYLKNLTVKGYEINFYKEKLSYEIVIDKSVNKLEIEYETDSDKATASIRNNDPINVINPIIITVTAEDGSTKDYTIKLTYKALSNNINIKKLTIENHNFEFDSTNKNYDIVISENEKNLNFNIELEDENAKYEIQDNNDLVNGSVIKIKVIAENLTETTYNFNIIKETTTVPKKKNNFFTILLIFLILGIIGVVVFKFIRNILPAKADEKYDYE